MAPVPKEINKPMDNNMDESGAEAFHNPNLAVTAAAGNSDSSDEEYADMVAPGGYSLLPSEPSNYHDDSASNDESDNEGDSNNFQSDSTVIEGGASVMGSECEYLNNENLPDAVLSSEADSAIPTTQSSEDMSNPAAREKYPHGKIPSYLHVPSLPREKEGHLWNEKRPGMKKQTLDSGHESAILKAMSGFQLPPESIPAWAKKHPRRAVASTDSQSYGELQR